MSKSSVSRWARDLPKPVRGRSREESSAAARRGWEATLERREAERQETGRRAAEAIGRLTDRELFLVGVGPYWSEGTKSKPYRRGEKVIFVNSDPGMIKVYLAWLALLGVTQERRAFRVMIHERADVAGAERFWAEHVGVETGALSKTTLKKHSPRTVRKNTGEGYRGVLVVTVRQAADLYRRIEGWWYGIVLGVEPATR